MILADLLDGFILESVKIEDIRVRDLQQDSRLIKPGDVFFLLGHYSRHSLPYIKDAIARGAVAVVCEDQYFLTEKRSIPFFYVAHLNERLGLIASRFYKDPSASLTVIGVTGTNGKSSTTFLLAEVLARLGFDPAVVGTLGVGRLNQLSSTGMTTPNAIELQRRLAELNSSGVDTVLMEVSSHALDQYRVAGVKFAVAVFTNLTRDHLDYHKTWEAYVAAKRRLFSYPGLKKAVLNFDDAIGQRWFDELKNDLEICGYAESDLVDLKDKPKTFIYASQILITDRGTQAMIHGSFGSGLLKSPLLGRFNVSNQLAVIGVLGLLGIPLDRCLAQLQYCVGVPGRMQVIHSAHAPFSVIVDYAHTPDALEKVLRTIKEFVVGRLICVFGCGGNRDTGKRPLMAKIATSLADYVVMTSDNPRHESPADIISDMMAGIQNTDRVVVEPDRAHAIRHAFRLALKGDVVLIAGKGHERVQIIGDQVLDFDDVLVAQELMKEMA